MIIATTVAVKGIKAVKSAKATKIEAGTSTKNGAGTADGLGDVGNLGSTVEEVAADKVDDVAGVWLRGEVALGIMAVLKRMQIH